MTQQAVEEEAAWHALMFIQVHREREKETENKSNFFHFFCCGAQCMHKQCNLFKSHYIPLFMSDQAEAKIQDYRVSQVERIYSL